MLLAFSACAERIDQSMCGPAIAGLTELGYRHDALSATAAGRLNVSAPRLIWRGEQEESSSFRSSSVRHFLHTAMIRVSLTMKAVASGSKRTSHRVQCPGRLKCGMSAMAS